MVMRSAVDSRAVEIVEFGSDAPTCPLPARLPTDVKGPVATFMQGKAIVCPGDYGQQCFEYSFTTGAWSPRLTLDVKRASASETLLDENKWWITGGHDGGTVFHVSTVVYNGTNLTPGPELPRPTAVHCVLKVNATHYFLAGGKSDASTTVRTAHLLEYGTGVWTALPAMLRARRGHGCHVLGGGDKILVTGGRGDLDAGQTTEVLSLATMTWSLGPVIPNGVHFCCGTSSVGNTQANLYLFGGFGSDSADTDEIYMYHPSISQWSTLKKKLAAKTHAHAVIKLPHGTCWIQ